jgi:hypothetical protein
LSVPPLWATSIPCDRQLSLYNNDERHRKNRFQKKMKKVYP